MTAWSWPPALEAELIRLFNDGLRVKVIAHRVDRPQSAVSRHLQRLQLQGRCPRRKRFWSDADGRVMEAALTMNVSYDDLAAAFGCSRDAVKIQASKLRRALRSSAANDAAPAVDDGWIEDQLQLDLAG